MHYDVKQCFHGSDGMVVVVVMNKANMVLYFPEARNLNGSNADMCSDVAGPSSSSSGDLFELSDKLSETISLLFSPLQALEAAILDLSVNTSFGACFIIIHKVYLMFTALLQLVPVGSFLGMGCLDLVLICNIKFGPQIMSLSFNM